MARNCCDGASSLCNCVIRPVTDSPNVVVTQPEAGVYEIEVTDAVASDICSGIQSLTNNARTLAASDKIVVLNSSNECEVVLATTSATNGALPAGIIVPYGGDTAPAGWLMCDGNSYATGAYPDLYAVIGYNFGGSGSSFQVPALQGRQCMGAGGVTGLALGAIGGNSGSSRNLQTTHLPDHDHSLSITSEGENRTHGHTVDAGQSGFQVARSGVAGVSIQQNAVFNQTWYTDYINTTDGAQYNLGLGDQFHTHVVSGSTNGTSGAAATAFSILDASVGTSHIIKT